MNEQLPDGYCEYCDKEVHEGQWHWPDHNDLSFCSEECAEKYEAQR